MFPLIRDPYQVLGIQRGATEDEIKKAYRKKAKECHPDMHPDDPDATQKMNEVNEAYDMLMHPEKYRGSQIPWQNGQSGTQGDPFQGTNPFYTYTTSGAQGWNPFGDFFGGSPFYTTPPVQDEPGDSPQLQAVVTALQRRDYRLAMQILTGMPQEQRIARWHYLMALIHEGSRNPGSAQIEIRRAIELDPNNLVYRQVLERYTHAAEPYAQRSHGSYRQVIDPRMLIGTFCLPMLFCRFGFCCC